MGIAFTGGPVSNSTATAEARADVINAIDAAAVACGWEREALVDGWKYTLSSPQLLGMKLTVRDTGRVISTGPFTSAPAVDLTPMSVDELRTGRVQVLRAEAGHEERYIANCCQLFTAKVGDAGLGPGYSFQCGVPFIAEPEGECADALEMEPVTEAWWAQGDWAMVGGPWSTTFRQCFWGGDWATMAKRWAGCHNGRLAQYENDATGLVRLVPICRNRTWPYYSAVGGAAARTRLWNGDPLYFDPLIMWGEPSDNAPTRARIRGQVYDAMWRSLDAELDEVFTIDGLPWFSYTDQASSEPGLGSRPGTLLLLMQAPAGDVLGNYAY